MRSRSTRFIKFLKILDLSELSPNVNSLDTDKKILAENLTVKLVLSSALTLEVWTLCLDLTFLHLISLFFTCLRVFISSSSSLLVDFFSRCIFIFCSVSLDCFDTVNKFVEKKMEESMTTTSLKNARKSYQTIQDIGQTKCCSSSPLLRIGHLKNGYQFWRKMEDRRKGSNVAVNPNYSQKFLLRFEHYEDIQEVQSILHCKTMYRHQTVSPSIFIT